MKAMLTPFALLPAMAHAHVDSAAHLHDYQAALLLALLAGVAVFHLLRIRGG